MVNPVFVGMVFESFIIVIAIVMQILIMKKYVQKRHRLTLYLFIIFLNYLLAIIFSWLSKVLVLYSDIEYIYDDTAPDPGTTTSWILLRITDFRISFVFLTIAIYLSYVLKVNLYDKGYNNVQRILVIVFAIFTAVFSLIVYENGNTLFDTFAFLFIFILMASVYFPFFIRTYGSYKSTAEPQFQKAFLSLALMSLFFILILLNFLFDRLVILIIGGPGFTPFYFMAWTFAILGIFGAYFGYIRPKSSE